MPTVKKIFMTINNGLFGNNDYILFIVKNQNLKGGRIRLNGSKYRFFINS